MTLRLRPYQQGSIKTFTTLLCDGFVIEGFTSVRALAQRLREEAPRHPGFRLLATLENFGQASYTSGHATDMHGLDSVEGHDISGLDASLFEDGEHTGYFSTKAEFPFRLLNLARKAEGVRFEDLGGKLLWGVDDRGFDFFGLNGNPDGILNRNEVGYVQLVPVAHAYEAIAAFPNGYFTGDLSPMENYAAAKHFETHYGYALFGIGASYVGYLKTRELSDFELAALARDVLALHRDAPADAAERVLQTIRRSDLLLFEYTDS